MNIVLETWRRGWKRLINQPYYPPSVLETLSSNIYHHVFWLIRGQVYLNTSGLHYNQINEIVKHLIYEMLTKERLPKMLSYRHFTKPKKDGTERQLVEPNTVLKDIQTSLLKSKLQALNPHPAAVGYRKKMSIADHVWAHAGAEIIITADIQDFFPSTTTDRVRAWWQTLYDEDVAQIFTLLTTYQGGLPQGAPTSPTLSNLVNFEMDRQITNRVGLSGGTYTRYADDMVFSWHHRPPSDFERAMRAILRANGYDLHPQKGWQVYHRRDEPEITGAILTKNGRVVVPDWVNQRIRELAPLARRDEHAQYRLSGYLGYKQMVEKRRR